MTLYETLYECLQALTSATLAGLSDIVAQRIVSRGALNWRRTAAIAVRTDHAPKHTVTPSLQKPKMWL